MCRFDFGFSSHQLTYTLYPDVAIDALAYTTLGELLRLIVGPNVLPDSEEALKNMSQSPFVRPPRYIHIIT